LFALNYHSFETLDIFTFPLSSGNSVLAHIRYFTLSGVFFTTETKSVGGKCDQRYAQLDINIVQALKFNTIELEATSK
jgi:hypothetical protein